MESFSVRCIFRWEPTPGQQAPFLYEERITLWQADTAEQAAELAEREAEGYAQDHGAEYLEYWQSYVLADPVDAHGIEVFSLLRESPLPPDEYLDTFFDTGAERQQDVP